MATKWKIIMTVSVSDNWIEDGFDMTERKQDIEDSIKSMLPYAYDHEVKVDMLIAKNVTQ